MSAQLLPAHAACHHMWAAHVVACEANDITERVDMGLVR